jgi:proline iminopeptidase
MKKIFKLFLKAFVAVLAILIIAFISLYFYTAGSYEVAKTVAEDSSIPHIKLGNRVFHAETFGADTNETVIVLHGGPGNDYRYLLTLKPLSDNYHLVFYDQRGTGLSPRVDAAEQSLENSLTDLNDIINYYSPNKPVSIIGHSWGGMLASGYIARQPDRVRKVVIAEPGMLTSEQAKIFYDKFAIEFSFSIISELAIIWFESLHVEGDDQAGIDYFMGRLTAIDSDENPTRKYYCDDLESINLPNWRLGGVAAQEIVGKSTNSEGDIEIDLVSGLENYTNKVLFITSECNEIIGTEFQREHMKYFLNLEHVEMKNTGHAMFTHKPQESVDIIRKYFAEKDSVETEK